MKNIWIRNRTQKYSMILGHRGAMGIAPENTITSFKEAFKYNVDLFELDVHLSKDKKLIVIHDHYVDRTTNGKGLVKELTSKKLKKLDAGIKFNKKFKGEKIPFLEEVFDLMKENFSVRLNIEIKNGPIFYKGIEEKIIKLIDKYNFYERIIISSFDHYTLKKIKDINPKIYTAILYGCNIFEIEKYIKKLKVSAIHPHNSWVTKELVKKMHSMNIAVNTWVINTKEDFIKFSKMGVDSIGTNYPNLMQTLINQK